jgi:hypothetical protein
MENITIIEIEDPLTKEITQHVIIDHGNEQFTSMTKEHYDKIQGELND